jgi:hypothetical protein
MLLGLTPVSARINLQVTFIERCAHLLLLCDFHQTVLAAFQPKENDFRRILNEVVNTPTAVYQYRFSFAIKSSSYHMLIHNRGSVEDIIQNITDSILYGFGKFLSNHKGSLLCLPSAYEITLMNLFSGQSDSFIIFDRSLLLILFNSTAPAFVDNNALITDAIIFFQTNAPSSEIQNLVSPATVMVSHF